MGISTNRDQFLQALCDLARCPFEEDGPMPVAATPHKNAVFREKSVVITG